LSEKKSEHYSFLSKIKTSSLLKSGFLVFCFLLGGRIIQFAKEIFVANEIGISPELDAFIMAALILSISSAFLIEPIGYALLPIFVKLKQNSIESANLLFTKVVLLAIFIGICCCALQLFLLENILSFFVGGLDKAHQGLTKSIVYQLTPFYFFNFLSLLFGIYLNAINKNFLYSVYPAFPALFTILFFLFIPLNQPIFQQVYGFNIGSFFVLGLLIYSCYKNGYRPALNFVIDENFKNCLKQWTPLIFSALLITINPVVDKQMAAELGAGNVSHLEYGVKLFSIFSGFAISGISTILYPFYSEKVARKDYDGIAHFLKNIVKYATVPLVLGTSFVLIFSTDIIRLLFERGAFQATDTKIVGELMNYYMISFPIMTLGIIAVRLINALQLNKIVLVFSIVNLVLNISLNILFIRSMGLKGIALSTSVVYTVNALLMWASIVWFFKKGKGLKNNTINA